MIAQNPRSDRASRPRAFELVVVGLMLAVGVGGVLLCRQHLAAIQAEADARIAETNDQIVRLRQDVELLRREQQVRRTMQENQALRPVASHESPAVTLRVQALSRLAQVVNRDPFARSHLRMMRMRNASLAAQAKIRAKRTGAAPPAVPAGPAFMIDGNGRLPPRFGELFDLSDAECTRLEQAFVSIATQVDARILANSSVRELSEGSAVLRVEPVPDATAFRDQFIAAFQTVAGAERYQSFAILNGAVDDGGAGKRSPAEFFQSFGGEPARTVTITRDEQGYRFEMRRDDGTGRQSGSVSDLTSLRERIGSLVSLLPPGF